MNNKNLDGFANVYILRKILVILLEIGSTINFEISIFYAGTITLAEIQALDALRSEIPDFDVWIYFNLKE